MDIKRKVKSKRASSRKRRNVKRKRRRTNKFVLYLTFKQKLGILKKLAYQASYIAKNYYIYVDNETIRKKLKNNELENIEYWSTHFVTDMSELFRDHPDFDEDISGWDVSNVSSMYRMLKGCHLFDQDLEYWDTCNVTDSSEMFFGCSSFNHSIGQMPRNVTARSMFEGATNFNKNIDNLLNGGKTLNTSRMFFGCVSYDQPANDWDLRNVKDASEMFSGATSYNQYLGLNMFSIENMNRMYYGCTSYNQPDHTDYRFGNGHSLLKSKAPSMQSMYYGCTSLDQDFSELSVSEESEMDGMFDNTKVEKIPSILLMKQILDLLRYQ